jgi:pyruvate/2-oxoglutarate dehydrogenase complex dihydrolipoamide dehydrogenase (E3) component
MQRMRKLRADIAYNDSAERFKRELGVDVFIGRGTFLAAGSGGGEGGGEHGQGQLQVVTEEDEDEESAIASGDAQEKETEVEKTKKMKKKVVTLRFKKAVVATGGRPLVPPIPGLGQHPAAGCGDGRAGAGAGAGASGSVRFHTNETIFNLEHKPRRLGVIGAGPIGCELAQVSRERE